MICFGYKGGIGSSSRLIQDEESGTTYTIGCMVLSNFGRKEDFQIAKYHLGFEKEARATISENSRWLNHDCFGDRCPT